MFKKIYSVIGIGLCIMGTLMSMNNKRPYSQISNDANKEESVFTNKKQKTNNVLQLRMPFDQEFKTIAGRFNELTDRGIHNFIATKMQTLLPVETDWFYTTCINRYGIDQQNLKIIMGQTTSIMQLIIQDKKKNINKIQSLTHQGYALTIFHLCAAVMKQNLDLCTVIVNNFKNNNVTIVKEYTEAIGHTLRSNTYYLASHDNMFNILLLLKEIGYEPDQRTLHHLFVNGLHEAPCTNALEILPLIKNVNEVFTQQSLVEQALFHQAKEALEALIKAGATIAPKDISQWYSREAEIHDIQWSNCECQPNTCLYGGLHYDIEYSLQDTTYAIANLLGGTLPQSNRNMQSESPDAYANLLKNPHYQQLCKDAALYSFFKHQKFTKQDIASINKLLLQNADSNVSHQKEDDFIYSTFLDLDLHRQQPHVFLLLLSFGANLNKAFQNSEEHARDPVTKNTLFLAYLGIQYLQGCGKNRFRVQVDDVEFFHNYIMPSFDNWLRTRANLLLQSSNSLALSDEYEIPVNIALQAFASFFEDGTLFKTLVDGPDTCWQTICRVLLRFPKAARTLLLYAPFRHVANSKKAKFEKFLINEMRNNKDERGYSFYEGPLMLGNTTMLTFKDYDVTLN